MRREHWRDITRVPEGGEMMVKHGLKEYAVVSRLFTMSPQALHSE